MLDWSDAKAIARIKNTDIKLLKWNDNYVITLENTVVGASHFSVAMGHFLELVDHDFDKIEWNIEGLGFYDVPILTELFRGLLAEEEFSEEEEFTEKEELSDTR